jgi:uncharacterized protein
MIPKEMTSMPILFVGDRLHPIGRILLFALAFVVAVVVSRIFLPASINWAEFDLFLAILLIVLSLAFVVEVDDRPAASFGLRINRRAMRDLAIGIAIPVVELGLILTIELAVGWVRVLGFAWNWQALGIGLRRWPRVALFEELLSRGYPFQCLLTMGGRWFGPVLGLGLTSFVFGELHGGNPNVTSRAIIILIVIGLEFGIAYLITRRLWLPIGMHFSWNLVEGTLLGYPVSGRSWPSFLTLEQTGPVSWTGGDFGPEGGWLVLLVSLLDMSFLLGLASVGFWKPDPYPREVENQHQRHEIERLTIKRAHPDAGEVESQQPTVLPQPEEPQPLS